MASCEIIPSFDFDVFPFTGAKIEDWSLCKISTTGFVLSSRSIMQLIKTDVTDIVNVLENKLCVITTTVTSFRQETVNTLR